MTSHPTKEGTPEADVFPMPVGRLGYYILFSILAGATTAVACGLISTWNPGTSTADWIGHQILFGLRGMGLQMVSFFPFIIQPSASEFCLRRGHPPVLILP
jgi:hypothetical protein